MYINSFLTELTKKIETVESQLQEFDKKIEKINSIKLLITKKTLKDLNDLTGTDLVNLTKEDFAKVLEVFRFDDPDDKIKMFFNSSVVIKVYQKLINLEDVEINNKDEVDKSIKWLDLQVKYIKEYIDDFNNNNKEFYNSLKSSDNLYKKYIGYFKNEKLVQPIYDIEEFNELIKKSGIITTDKWQLLKYVAEENLKFYKRDTSNGKSEEVVYSDEEILNMVENILKDEKSLLIKIDDDKMKYAYELIDMEEEKLKEINISGEDLIDYQKMPIICTMNKIYLDTKKLLKNETNKDAITIEKNLKNLKDFVESYEVLKKLEI